MRRKNNFALNRRTNNNKWNTAGTLNNMYSYGSGVRGRLRQRRRRGGFLGPAMLMAAPLLINSLSSLFQR
jgi:hypothetical protein